MLRTSAGRRRSGEWCIFDCILGLCQLGVPMVGTVMMLTFIRIYPRKNLYVHPCCFLFYSDNPFVSVLSISKKQWYSLKWTWASGGSCKAQQNQEKCSSCGGLILAHCSGDMKSFRAVTRAMVVHLRLCGCTDELVEA